MSKIHEKPGFFRRLIGGRGFYAVLGLCLLAATGAGLAGVLRPTPSEPSTESTKTSQHPVDTPVTGVKDDRTTTRTTAGTTVPTTAATTAAEALYVYPCGNTVEQPFSDGKPVYNRTMGDYRTHNGTDFTAKTGQTVRAMADGTVAAVTEDYLWGNVIVIDHGYGLVARYCGVLASGVKQGDRVKVGQNIGTVAAIPCESGSYHLHLEILSGGDYVDPVKVIDLPAK